MSLAGELGQSSVQPYEVTALLMHITKGTDPDPSITNFLLVVLLPEGLERTCTVARQQVHGGLQYCRVQTGQSAQYQPNQAGLDLLREQGQQEKWQVGQVAQLAQHRGHNLSLGCLSHALDSGKEQDSLQHLQWSRPTDLKAWKQ